MAYNQGTPISGTPIPGQPIQGTPIGGQPIQGTPISGHILVQGVPIGVAPSAPPGAMYPPEPTNPIPVYPPLPTGYAPFQDCDMACEPPQYMDITQYNPRFIQPFHTIPMSHEEVREAVTRHVSGKVMYSSSAVNQMVYTNVDVQACYLYQVDSFCEKRETKWVVEAHDPCKPVDGPQNGPIALPWDVPVVPSHEFKKDKKKVTVPHSEHIQSCHRCCGRGNVMCKHCNGAGSKVCSSCHGSGIRSRESCSSCHVTGRDKCIWCHGNGFKMCDQCYYHGSLKYSIELKVTWSVQEDFYISNGCGLKEKLLKEAPGVKLLVEENVRLKPVMAPEFYDAGITQASNNLIQKHNDKCAQSGQRVVKQRHSITAVPVAVVSYTRKGSPATFFVYGDPSDRKVHFDSYPSKNCCIS